MNPIASDDVVGLMPAAGYGTRLGNVGFSKELHPVRLGPGTAARFARQPEVVSDFLLEAFAIAGIRHTIVVIRDGKWDVAEHIGNGSAHRLSVAYVMANESPGVPWTIDAAFPFIRGKTVAVGFPDMLFEPVDLFTPLLTMLHSRSADVALALMPTDRPEKADIVATDSEGMITRIRPKPQDGADGLAWMAAVWNASFSEYLHAFVDRYDLANSPGEIYLGDIIQLALAELRIVGLPFSGGRFLDVGTRDDSARAAEPW